MWWEMFHPRLLSLQVFIFPFFFSGDEKKLCTSYDKCYSFPQAVTHKKPQNISANGSRNHSFFTVKHNGKQ